MGMRQTTQVVYENLSPETAAYIDAFAAGVNAYIEEVKKGNLAAPSELEVFAPILGAPSVGDLLKPFERRDVAAMTAVIMYGPISRLRSRATTEMECIAIAF